MTGLQMKYFVLKPKGAFDDPYAKASRTALQAYAREIRDENPQLYNDLEKWRIEEQGAANEAHLMAKLESEDTDGSRQ